MTILRVLREGIPLELQRHDRWVLWQSQPRGNRLAKVPVRPNKQFTSVNNPDHWSDFESVWDAYQSGGFSGLGFCLAGDGLVFVDYDSAGERLESSDLNDFLVRGWTERSPSGNGLHTVVIARKPVVECRFKPQNSKVKEIEIYDRDRYFTVTGHTVGDCDDLWENQVDIDRLCRNFPQRHQCPCVVTELSIPDEQILEKMMSGSQSGKILKLWSGECGTDHSAADLALMNYLAYWTGNDPLAMERLFGMSALGQRKKWLDRSDYRRRTIDRALLGGGSSKFCA
jgi:primase-polymerase (primpol)-like protein